MDDREDIGYFLLIVGAVFTYLTIRGIIDDGVLRLFPAAIALICLAKGFQWTGLGSSVFAPGSSDNPVWAKWGPAVLLAVSGAVVVCAFILLAVAG